VRKAIRQLLAVVAATVFSSLVFADYVVNRVDYVDSVTGVAAPFSQLWSLNNNGQAIGFASYDGGVNGFSFIYDPVSGKYFPTPQPQGFDGVTSSALVGSINDAGVMTGTAGDPTVARGFILANGVFTFFSNPPWINTYGRSIGNPTAAHPQGLIVGYLDNGSADTPDTVGFIHDPVTSSSVTLDQTRSPFTIAHGQNAAGRIVGSVFGDGAVREPGPWAFVFTPTTAGDPMLGGTVSFFRLDGKRTRARGINDKGVMAGTVQTAPTWVRTWIGVPGNFQILDVPSITSGTCTDGTPTAAFPEHINNAGQVAGLLTDSACKNSGYIATPAALPTGTSRNGAATFNVNVTAGEPMFINLPVAPGYDYAVGKHDPRFAAVRLPIGIGSNKFVLVVRRRAFALNAGQLFDFREHGFKKGVKAFRVACVDPAAIDAANPSPFPTGLTFAKAGTFTGTQKPRAAVASEHDDDHAAPSAHPLTQAECRQRLLSLRDAGGPDEDDD
jgi:hypothetical protein